MLFLYFINSDVRRAVKQYFRKNCDFVPTSQIKVASGISKVFSHPCDIKTLLYFKCDLKILASLWLRPWTATNHLNTLSLKNVFTLFLLISRFFRLFYIFCFVFFFPFFNQPLVSYAVHPSVYFCQVQ